MAWRTTIDLVKGIIETDTTIIGSDGSGLDPFIDVANSLVTEMCLSSGYTDARLELIERWLSAHFYAIRDPRVMSEGAGSVSQSYQIGGIGPELKSTPYGVQVLVIDTQGSLAALSKRAELGINRKAGVTWLGTKRCL